MEGYLVAVMANNNHQFYGGDAITYCKNVLEHTVREIFSYKQVQCSTVGPTWATFNLCSPFNSLFIP